MPRGGRRALAHGHRFAQVAFKAHSGDGAIGHRHLPWSYTTPRTVIPPTPRSPMVMRKDLSATVGSSSTFCATSFKSMPVRSMAGKSRWPRGPHVALHFGGLPSNTRTLLAGPAHYPVPGRSVSVARSSAPTAANRQRSRLHMALRGFPARWRGRSVPATHCSRFPSSDPPVYLARLKIAPRSALLAIFRESVRQAARTHVVDGNDRIVCTHLPAGVDDFLRLPAFHFRLPRWRDEVQVGSRPPVVIDEAALPPPMPIRMPGPPSCTSRLPTGMSFLCVCLRHSRCASDHDRLVVAKYGVFALRRRSVHTFGSSLLQIQDGLFVRERGAAQRAFDHDSERRRRSGLPY